MQTFKLKVEHPRPSRAPMFVTLRGTPEQARRFAVEVLNRMAQRFGISPLALDWELLGAGA